MEIALLGRKLGHSLSPEIHTYLGDYFYELHPLEPDELGPFLSQKDYRGLNVTIPYKKDVLPYMDEISPIAERIGCVNTIVKRKDGTLFGDNTDYFGFSYMARRAGISFSGQKVIILGSGGASLTARLVASDEGAKEVIVVSRSGANNYDNLYLHFDANVIVNCTPVGMYPNNGESLVDLTNFSQLCGVLDMIYNPCLTKLLIDAKKLGIKYSNGLTMLVAQAAKSAEYFRDNAHKDVSIDNIVSKVEFQQKNIIFVGMPGCGKSTQAKLLAKVMNRQFVDTDELIVKTAGKPIPQIFEENGETHFRDIETKCVMDVSKERGLVIATGGGAVLREINRESIISNSTVIFLHRDIKNLETKGRPLSQSGDLESMYKKRLPFYKEVADIDVSILNTPKETHKQILSTLGI